MENQIIEYIRKNGKIGSGVKKGVLYAGIDPEFNDMIDIGFSMCSPEDDFDVVAGKKRSGFGLEIAKERSIKWCSCNDYFIQLHYTEADLEDDDFEILRIVNPDPMGIVEIPPSIVEHLKKFIERCKKYYSDKDFPVWTDMLMVGKPYPQGRLVYVDATEEYDF